MKNRKRLPCGLTVDSASYIDYVYTVQRDSYMIDFDVRFVGMQQLLSPTQSDMEIVWQNIGPQNEKGFDNENNYTTIAYNFPGDDGIEELGISKESKEETINAKLKWVAFKQQFFSSIFIAEDDFMNGSVRYTTFAPGEGKIKKLPRTALCSLHTTDRSVSLQLLLRTEQVLGAETLQRPAYPKAGTAGWLDHRLDQSLDRDSHLRFSREIYLQLRNHHPAVDDLLSRSCSRR